MPLLPKDRKPSLFRRLLCDRRANFAVMTALSAPFAIALSAVAVDQGSLYTERRSAQALTDLAAITAASNIDKANAAVLLALKDNGVASAQIGTPGAKPTPGRPVVSVVPGRYDATAGLGSRFEAGGQPFNAVRVSLRKIGTLHFGSALMAPPIIGTTATARTSAEAAFSIGSGLLAVDTGNSPILNAILGGLLGTTLSLNVMDYKGLIRTDIDVLSFVEALAVKLDMTGVTYDQVLASTASVGQIADAMAEVPGIDGPTKIALQALAGKSSATARIMLDQYLDLGEIGHLGVGQKPRGLAVNANAMAMLTAAAALANGEHQIDLDLGANVPSLLSTKLSIVIGQPQQYSPWLTVGDKGAVVRTAQTRIRLVVGVGGLGTLLGKVVTLPLYIDIAYAEGKLADISCSTGRPESLQVKIDATPGVADLRIADVDSAAMSDFSKTPALSPARLVDVSLLGLGLVSVSGQARAAIENTETTHLNFTYPEISSGVVKDTSTHDLTGSLTGSLLGSLQLEANVLGIKIAVPAAVTSALGTTLGAATKPIDSLIDNLLQLLGVKIGNADIRVTGATCGRSVLVQ
jgi:uncharacterized membrane protein